ncbi:MAG TPA: PIN domain-containing protein [Gemmatimonadaceae bacterium]
MVRARREATDAIPVTVLLDTNVLLDVILDRTPWADDATTLLDRIARHEARGYVAAHAVTTVYYLVERAKGRGAATTAVSDLLDILDVVALEGADFRRALALGLKDYEDAVQAAACLKVGARFLVTRNERDFKSAPVIPRSAAEVLALFAPIENT